MCGGEQQPRAGAPSARPMPSHGTSGLQQLAAAQGLMLAAQPGGVPNPAGHPGSAGFGQGQGSQYGGPGASSVGQAAYGGLGVHGALGPGQGLRPGGGAGAAAAYGAPAAQPVPRPQLHVPKRQRPSAPVPAVTGPGGASGGGRGGNANGHALPGVVAGGPAASQVGAGAFGAPDFATGAGFLAGQGTVGGSMLGAPGQPAGQAKHGYSVGGVVQGRGHGRPARGATLGGSERQAATAATGLNSALHTRAAPSRGAQPAYAQGAGQGSGNVSQLGASWGGFGGLPMGQQLAQQQNLQASPEPITMASRHYQPAQLGGGAQAAPYGNAAASGQAAWMQPLGIPATGLHAPGLGPQQGHMAMSAGMQAPGAPGPQLVSQRQQPQQAGFVQPGQGPGRAASAPSQAALQASAAVQEQAQSQSLAQPSAWQQQAPARHPAHHPQAHVQLQAGHAPSQQQRTLQAQTQARSGAGPQHGGQARHDHQTAAVQASAPASAGQPQIPGQQGHGGYSASAGSAAPLASQAPFPGSGSGGSGAAAYGSSGLAGGSSGSAAAHGSAGFASGGAAIYGSYPPAAMAGGTGFGSAAAQGFGGGSEAYYGVGAPVASAAGYSGRDVRAVAGLQHADLQPAASAGTAFPGSAAGAPPGGQGLGGEALGAPGRLQYGAQAHVPMGAAQQAGAPAQWPQHAHGQYPAGGMGAQRSTGGVSVPRQVRVMQCMLHCPPCPRLGVFRVMHTLL